MARKGFKAVMLTASETASLANWLEVGYSPDAKAARPLVGLDSGASEAAWIARQYELAEAISAWLSKAVRRKRETPDLRLEADVEWIMWLASFRADDLGGGYWDFGSGVLPCQPCPDALQPTIAKFLKAVPTPRRRRPGGVEYYSRQLDVREKQMATDAKDQTEISHIARLKRKLKRQQELQTEIAQANKVKAKLK